MSKFSTHNTSRNQKHVPNRGHNNAPRHNPKPRFKVVSKADALAEVMRIPTHHSKFVPAKSGGLMAAIKGDGRFVFPDSRGPQPKNDGKNWQFQIVAENPKQTVFFARIITAEASSSAIQIVIEKSGKMVCVGRRLIVAPFRSKKPKKVQFAEYRHASPTTGFERNDDDYFYADDGYGDSHHGCGCGHDHDDEGDCDHDGDNDFGSANSYFHEATVSIWDSLPTKPVNCHSCGFEDCRCDGPGSDWVPARTTLNVLQ